VNTDCGHELHGLARMDLTGKSAENAEGQMFRKFYLPFDAPVSADKPSTGA
jgi:hypothetical protein